MRAALITSGADLFGRFRDFTEAEIACTRVLLSHGTLPGKTSALLFGSEKLPSINDLLGLQDNGSGSENWTIFLDTFFASKSQFFFTPHVISRKLNSNYTLASARPLLAGIV